LQAALAVKALTTHPRLHFAQLCSLQRLNPGTCYLIPRCSRSYVCFLMAARTRRTASWAGRKTRISPPLPVSRAISAPVVAIDRISSPQKIPPMVSQITLEAHEVQPTVLEAMSTSLTGVSADAKPTTNDSFPRHDTYFFKDGNITFLVRVTALCVPVTC
jgi:hypothetical protein